MRGSEHNGKKDVTLLQADAIFYLHRQGEAKVKDAAAALEVYRVVESVLGLGLHHEHENPLPHGGSNTGELYSKVLTVHPPDNRLVDSRGPIVIREEQRKLQERSGL